MSPAAKRRLCNADQSCCDAIDPTYEAHAPRWNDFSREPTASPDAEAKAEHVGRAHQARVTSSGTSGIGEETEPWEDHRGEQEKADVTDGGWFEEDHVTHHRQPLPGGATKLRTVRKLLSSSELAMCAEHRILRGGVMTSMHQHVRVRRTASGRYVYTATENIPKTTRLLGSRGMLHRRVDFEHWATSTPMMDSVPQQVAYRVYELTQLVGKQHTDSALFWCHADLYPTEEECAELLLESNRYDTVLRIATLAAEIIHDAVDADEAPADDGRMGFERLVRLTLVLDCNRNGLGYFPAAVFGIENSKTPNCTPEVRAATEGHRMHMVSNRPIIAGEELSCSFRCPELTGAGLPSHLPASPRVSEADGEYVHF